jgi:signal transduction histidine kinase
MSAPDWGNAQRGRFALIAASLKILNDFIEDSAVIAATPYLLGRGWILSAIFRDRMTKREAVRLGLVFGAVAVTEVIFPGQRYPYVTDTLTVGFAALAGGPLVGAAAAAVVCAGAIAFQPWPDWLIRTAGASLVAAVGSLFWRVPGRNSAFVALLTGIASQSVVVLFHLLPRAQSQRHGIDWHGIGSVLGNGLGMVITTTVFREAWVRVNSEQNRLAAEHAKAQAAQAQLAATKAKLAALRGRIHPHFLYNALTSISGLCGIAPDEAEEAAAQLGDLMRRTLDATTVATIPLSTELEYVRVYLAIEQRRFGQRLQLDWRIDEKCGDILVPPFSVQTLVENAVRHGMARVLRPVTILVIARHRGQHIQIAVKDNGSGMQRDSRPSIGVEQDLAVHGLQILASQLTMLFGPSARLRLFSVAEAGTLVAFAVPIGDSHTESPATEVAAKSAPNPPSRVTDSGGIASR